MKVPAEVQEAWNTVAKFLNEHEQIAFFVSPWPEWPFETHERRYTLHYIDENDIRKNIAIADEEWSRGQKRSISNSMVTSNER